MKTKGAVEVAIREDANVTEVDPIANLLDPDLIGSAIMQCLIENDPEGVVQVIEDHLYAFNKSKFLREAQEYILWICGDRFFPTLKISYSL